MRCSEREGDFVGRRLNLWVYIRFASFEVVVDFILYKKRGKIALITKDKEVHIQQFCSAYW